MFGKVLQRSRGDILDSLTSIASKRTYDLSATLLAPPGSAANLPQAPASPYKKRPMKLVYNKAEYYAFRLPSENAFLLSSFDNEDIFGKRKGIEHSPHIRAQLNLDSNLVFLYFILTILALGFEMKNLDEFKALRDNLVNHDMGRFEYDDFK